MASYQPAPILKPPPPVATQRTPESRHWRRYRQPTYVKSFAPITHVHFAPSRPHRLAVTAGAEVKLHAPRTNKVVKTVTRFKETARGGEIRKDGNLLVAGDDSGLVQVFNLNSREILKQIRVHEQPTHSTSWSPHSPSQLLSASDDTSLALHDLTTSSPITTFLGHTDYVRTASFLPSSPHLILSGSYDSTVRLWDTRTGDAEIIMSHAGYAVESVLPYPQGGLVLSAGGPLLRAFDLANPSKPLRSLSNHQKTITSLAFTSSGSRLLSGSLDQMVKVWDVASFKVVHTMRYSAPVLSLAISPDDTHLACGLADSTLSVRQRKALKNGRVDEGFQADDTLMNPSTYTSFLSAGTDLGDVFTKAETSRKKDLLKGVPFKGEEGELIVRDGKKIGEKGKQNKKLRVYDRFLKEFRYGAALDAALASDIPPTTTFSLLTELSSRDALRLALSSRDAQSLTPILLFLLRHLTHTHFGPLAIQVTLVLLDLYASVVGQSPEVDDLLERMVVKVENELRMERDVLQGVKGMVEMVMSNNVVGSARARAGAAGLVGVGGESTADV